MNGTSFLPPLAMPWPPNRATMDVVVAFGTTIRLVWSLLSSSHSSFWRESLQLLFMTVMALLLDSQEPRFLLSLPLKPRHCGGQGAGQGMLSVLWVCGGLLSFHRHDDTVSAAVLLVFNCLVVSDIILVLWLLLRSKYFDNSHRKTHAVCKSVDKFTVLSSVSRLSLLEIILFLCVVGCMALTDLSPVLELWKVQVSQSKSQACVAGWHGDMCPTIQQLFMFDNMTKQTGKMFAVKSHLQFLKDSDFGIAFLLSTFGMAVLVCWQLGMWCLPNTFTYGEGWILTQGTLLLMGHLFGSISEWTTIFIPRDGSINRSALVRLQSSVHWKPVEFAEVLCLGMLLAALALSPVLHAAAHQMRVLGRLRKGTWGVLGFCAFCGACVVFPMALEFLSTVFSRWLNVAVVLYWLALMAVSLPLMQALSQYKVFPKIILRKGYHLLAILIVVPVLLVQPALLFVALAVAFAALVSVEMVRFGKIPPLGGTIHKFLTRFTDSRDEGPIIISHFTLLLGVALPMWLDPGVIALLQSRPAMGEGLHWQPGSSLAATTAFVVRGVRHAAQVVTLSLPSLAGVITIGVGDTVASVVGSRCGRVPIVTGSRKSVEGTLGGFVAVMACWVFVLLCMARLSLSLAAAADLMLASLLACLLEAVTAQLDNLLIPLQHFALLLAFVAQHPSVPHAVCPAPAHWGMLPAVSAAASVLQGQHV